MAAMLVYRNNEIFLLWELTSILMQTVWTNFLLCCTPTWRQCKPPIRAFAPFSSSFFLSKVSFPPQTMSKTNWLIRAVALISCLLREHLCTNSPLYQSEAFYWRVHKGDNYVRRSFPQNRTCNEIIRAMAPFFLNFIKGFIPSTDDVEDEISDRPCLQKGPWR